MRSSIVISSIPQFLWHVKLHWQAENDEGTGRGLAVEVDAGSRDTRRQDGMLIRALTTLGRYSGCFLEGQTEYRRRRSGHAC
jgi:hypothetical protein